MTPSDLEAIDSVVVIGCGAIGLPLAVAFASRDLDVLGVDIDAERIAALVAGRVDASETRLAEALTQSMARGRLRFAPSCAPASVRRAFVVAVPTPVDDQDILPTAGLREACKAAVACARDRDLLVIRSTVPVGTTRRIAQDIVAGGRAIAVASCPDRTIAGQAFREQFSLPNVVGGVDSGATHAASALFRRLGEVVEVSTPEAGEAVKLFCNVQRDVTFALANHFALISEALGLDIAEIKQAASAGYPRFQLSRPGPVGGPCLPKDAVLLDRSASGRGSSPALGLTARRVNAFLLDHVATAIADHVTQAARAEPVIAVLGLAFKGDPPTSDTRGSFGIALCERLRAEWPRAMVRTWDPGTDTDVSIDSVLRGADVAVLANEHPSIKALDIDAAARAMRPGGMIYDVCGGFDRVRLRPPNNVQLRIFGRSPAFGGAKSRDE